MFLLLNTASDSDIVNCNLKWISCVCIATDMNIHSSHWVLPWWPNGKESTCQWKRHGFNPLVGKSPRTSKWQPLQYSCWEIPQTEEPGGLQSLRGRKRVRHNLATKHTWTVVAEVEPVFLPLGKMVIRTSGYSGWAPGLRWSCIRPGSKSFTPCQTYCISACLFIAPYHFLQAF